VVQSPNRPKILSKWGRQGFKKRHCIFVRDGTNTHKGLFEDKVIFDNSTCRRAVFSFLRDSL